VVFFDFSGKKNEPSNNSSNRKKTQNNNQSPEPQSAHRDTTVSIVTGDGGRGRGRIKKNVET